MTDIRDDRDLAEFVPIPEKGTARLTRAWLVVHGVAWGLLLVVLVVERRLAAIFAHFGVDLPRMTVIVIKVGHIELLLVPLYLILMGADWAILRATGRQGESPEYRAWAIGMLTVALLFFAATIVALILPLVGILSRLGD